MLPAEFQVRTSKFGQEAQRLLDSHRFEQLVRLIQQHAHCQRQEEQRAFLEVLELVRGCLSHHWDAAKQQLDTLNKPRRGDATTARLAQRELQAHLRWLNTAMPLNSVTALNEEPQRRMEKIGGSVAELLHKSEQVFRRRLGSFAFQGCCRVGAGAKKAGAAFQAQH